MSHAAATVITLKRTDRVARRWSRIPGRGFRDDCGL